MSRIVRSIEEASGSAAGARDMPKWSCRGKILAIYCQNRDESIPPDRGMRALLRRRSKRVEERFFPEWARTFVLYVARSLLPLSSSVQLIR